MGLVVAPITENNKQLGSVDDTPEQAAMDGERDAESTRRSSEYENGLQTSLRKSLHSERTQTESMTGNQLDPVALKKVSNFSESIDG